MDERQDKPEAGDAEGGVGVTLLHAVQRLAITHADAEKVVAHYRRRVHRASDHTEGAGARDGGAETEPPGPAATNREDLDAIADRIIKRYARMTAASGAAAGLAGVVPGIGTLVAALGGGAADTVVCLKLQVDMCMCLTVLYRHDLNGEDAKHLAFLLAAGAALEKAGVEGAVAIGSKAGVKVLQQYLRGAALVAIRELFKKVGLVFTRKALEKALPFGLGVVVGGGANYGLTTFVGKKAKQFFAIDSDHQPG